MLISWTHIKFFCYVSIIITTVFPGVFCWELVTHFWLVSFFLVFGCHIYLKSRGLCLVHCTVHCYCLLQYFTVSCICLSTCFHVLLALCPPSCNTKIFRWTQPGPVELSTWGQCCNLDTLLIFYLCHVQQLVLFYVS